MLILAIFLIGEMSSVLIHMFMNYIGDYRSVFRNKSFDRDNLAMIATFFGWITFPFFWYVAYKQLTLK